MGAEPKPTITARQGCELAIRLAVKRPYFSYGKASFRIGTLTVNVLVLTIDRNIFDVYPGHSSADSVDIRMRDHSVDNTVLEDDFADMESFLSCLVRIVTDLIAEAHPRRPGRGN